MKKYFTLLLSLLIFSCTKEKQNDVSQKNVESKPLNEILRKKGSTSTMSVAGFNTVKYTLNFSTIPATNFCSGNEFNVSGVPFILTHGKVSYLPDENNLWVYSGENGINGPLVGAGFAIKFKFKKGKTYKVLFKYFTGTSRIDGQLTNSITQNNICDITAPNLEFGNDKPKSSLPLSPVNLVSNSLEFTPETCYDYLWLSSVGVRTGIGGKVLLAEKIVIEETSLLEISGATLECQNSEADYTLTVGGYTISDSFIWSTTGDLQILGSNVGSSVRVKRNGNFGGSLSISANGCGLIASREFGTQNITFKNYELCDYTDSFTLEANPLPGVTGMSWEGVTFDNVVFDLGSSGWSAHILPNTKTVRFKGIGQCGPFTISHRISIKNCLN